MADEQKIVLAAGWERWQAFLKMLDAVDASRRPRLLDDVRAEATEKDWIYCLAHVRERARAICANPSFMPNMPNFFVAGLLQTVTQLEANLKYRHLKFPTHKQAFAPEGGQA